MQDHRAVAVAALTALAITLSACANSDGGGRGIQFAASAVFDRTGPLHVETTAARCGDGPV
ncbi:hypothetical protein AN218_08685 [Streptomyces nanshensis]|uniref:Uncharacterized protein n=1 Tax=Streptomyces nanshensis TaxID=518642 RepID=A0A1E7L847_9ACTN|nr:hypothetical protein AN218_08685 [Streptomyces nanshensis]